MTKRNPKPVGAADIPYNINLKRKTINLPNYWKLFHLQWAAWIFGVRDDHFKVVRWEIEGGENNPALLEITADSPNIFFNLQTEEAVDITYKSIDNVLASVGGLFTSAVGLCIFFYDMFFGHIIKKGYAERLHAKAAQNKELDRIFKLSGKEIKFENTNVDEFISELNSMNSFTYNFQ